MYSALTDLICAAFVFVLAAFLFAAAVAILMAVEALKFLHQMASAAFAVMSGRLASFAKPGIAGGSEEEPRGAFQSWTTAVVIKKLQHES